MLSGGIDSAYCLYKHLKDDKEIRLHHVNLSDREGRRKMEAKAVKAILGYFKHKNHLITYTESSVDFGTLRYTPFNYYLWAYWAGAIFKSNSNLTKIIIPRHSDAFVGSSGSGEQSNEAYINTIELISGRRPELLFPMLHLTKAEVIEDTPVELLKLTWYCRRPTPSQQPCKECKTCKQVRPTLLKRLS